MRGNFLFLDQLLLRIAERGSVLLVAGKHLFESVRRRRLQITFVKCVSARIGYSVGRGYQMRGIGGWRGIDGVFAIGVSTLAVERVCDQSSGERVDNAEKHDGY